MDRPRTTLIFSSHPSLSLLLFLPFLRCLPVHPHLFFRLSADSPASSPARVAFNHSFTSHVNLAIGLYVSLTPLPTAVLVSLLFLCFPSPSCSPLSHLPFVFFLSLIFILLRLFPGVTVRLCGVLSYPVDPLKWLDPAFLLWIQLICSIACNCGAIQYPPSLAVFFISLYWCPTNHRPPPCTLR